jgi:malate dehydrogenase (oxaloacetate-decarboxylating)(NADP+)
VLRAADVLLDEGLAVPVLVGRPKVIEARAERAGLTRLGEVEVINPESDPRYRDYVDLYFSLVGRNGVPPDAARTIVRTNTTVIAALALRRGEADAMLCGVDSPFMRHAADVRDVVGLAAGVDAFAAMSLLIANERTLFLVDTQANMAPDARQIAETTLRAARRIRQFGMTPKAALLSSSRFGSRDHDDARKMREAVRLLWTLDPTLEVDGEMHGDDALSPEVRARAMPESRLVGEANLLVFPTLDAAAIASTLLKELMDALLVGPFLLGTAKPAHILTPSVTSRGVLNMSAIVAVEAAARGEAARADG